MSNKISHYRKQARLSQQDLAEELEEVIGRSYTQANIGQYENSKHYIAEDVAKAIVKVFNKRGVKCRLREVFPNEAPKKYL